MKEISTEERLQVNVRDSTHEWTFAWIFSLLVNPVHSDNFCCFYILYDNKSMPFIIDNIFLALQLKEAQEKCLKLTNKMRSKVYALVVDNYSNILNHLIDLWQIQYFINSNNIRIIFTKLFIINLIESQR